MSLFFLHLKASTTFKLASPSLPLSLTHTQTQTHTYSTMLGWRKRGKEVDNHQLTFDAAAEGNLQQLIKIIKGDDSLVNAVDLEGKSPLHYAVLNEHIDVIKFLLINGAEINCPDQKGWTPLHCAGQTRNDNIYLALLEHSDIRGIPD